MEPQENNQDGSQPSSAPHCSATALKTITTVQSLLNLANGYSMPFEAHNLIERAMIQIDTLRPSQAQILEELRIVRTTQPRVTLAEAQAQAKRVMAAKGKTESPNVEVRGGGPLSDENTAEAPRRPLH